MTPESTICEGCRRTNPGGMKYVTIGNERVPRCFACRQELNVTNNLIDKDKYELLETKLVAHGIKRVTIDDVLTLLPSIESRGQAAKYTNLHRARHPQHYSVPTTGGAISHAIKGEPIQGRTPELTKAMQDATKEAKE